MDNDVTIGIFYWLVIIAAAAAIFVAGLKSSLEKKTVIKPKPNGWQSFLLVSGFVVAIAFLVFVFHNLVIIPQIKPWALEWYRTEQNPDEHLLDTYLLVRVLFQYALFGLIVILPLGVWVWRILGGKSAN